MNIAIAGYGAEGKSSYEYYSRLGHEITIADERENVEDIPTGVATILGAGAFEKLDGFDIVIRTAGLAPSRIKTDGKIWSSTNEFFAKCPAPIIGVTGTKGKGTTSSLIASILRAGGRSAHLLGNIGTPALEELPKIMSEDIVVFELSSFQLWDIEKSPHIAVVLMIEPDHLNVHTDFDDYVNAKGNIRRYQASNDVCIYHPTNPYSKQIAQSSEVGKAVRYSIKDDGAVYVADDTFKQNEQNICSVDELQLLGKHNQENACAAISVAKELSISNEAIAQGLRDFKGLPHRLKFVKEVAGVKYYDDSISTTPSSAIAAIRSFSQPKLLILGGSSKGADFKELGDAIVQTNVKQSYLIGEEASRIAQALENVGVRYEHWSGGLTELVTHVAESAEAGDVVLLSPACASFDMFTSYGARGDQFIRAVEALV